VKFKIFGFTISNEDSTSELSSTGAKAKTNTSMAKITKALEELEAKQLKYSEYKLQELSGLSINTIKKYRPFIERERERVSRTLFTSLTR